MTREEELDWLCRLRSEIYVYMPKEWLIPMNNALDMAISALSENKGEWIDKGNGSYVCSNCKTEWTTSQIEKMCFCPTCGNPKVRGDKAE